MRYIDFNQVLDYSCDIQISYKYQFELLEPTKVDLQQLKVTKLVQEWGIYPRVMVKTICSRSITIIDFNQVPDCSRDIQVSYKYHFELLEPTKVGLRQLKITKLVQEWGYLPTSDG